LSKTNSRVNRGWIWFFAILSILAVIFIGIQIWYNQRQQLTPEQLRDARARWAEKGPHDYDLQYTIKKIDATETFDVKVRGGKVTSVVMNGQLQLEPWQYRYHSIPALFGFIDDFLQIDSQPGSPRTFAVASFDPEDGHLIHYVRSVMSKRERQEMTVKLLPAS
jgi:hypothetical protein